MTLAELMKQKDFTREKLAEASVSESTITRALQGKNLQSSSKEKLAVALNISIEELTQMIKEQLPSDPIAELVDETLKKLTELGLDFKPPNDDPNANISESIKKDLCEGKLRYFRDEFIRIVNQVNNSKEKETQIKTLKDLVLYSAAWLVHRDPAIKMEECSQLSLCDGNNAWELRIYINTLLNKLEGVQIELIRSKEKGAYKLSEVKDAHQLGLSDSVDYLQMFCKLVRQLTAQEPVEEVCPEQVLSKDSPEWGELMACCNELNQRFILRFNSNDNVFAFSNLMIPSDLMEYIEDYLPELRVMTIQSDNGKTFLIPAKLKIHTLLVECLKIIENREQKLMGKNINTVDEKELTENNTEENKMNKNTVSNIIVNGDATVIVGKNTNNQQPPPPELFELIGIFSEIRTGLSPTLPSDSKVLESLQQTEQIKSSSPENIKKINRVLAEVKEYMKTGSQLGKLYKSAKKIVDIIKDE